MAYQAIEARNDGAVAWLTLNRPHNLNALSALMVEELEDYLHKLPTEHATRVVIMRGAGRAFCAGRRSRLSRRSADPLPAEDSHSRSPVMPASQEPRRASTPPSSVSG